MKKFFSAILLIAAMAFSVSTFVSCNDLVEEVEDVTAQAGANAEAIKALQAQLESGLASANAAVEAAKTAAEKAVAEAKKAAIEEALAEAAKLDAENTEAINALKAVVEAISGKITTLEGADAALQEQIDALEAYLKYDGEKSAVVEDLLKKLEALQAKVEDASVLDDIKDEFEQIKADIKKEVEELSTLGNIASAIAAQIQDITFVPTQAGNQITYLGKVQLATLNDNGLKTWQRTDDVKYVMATFEVRPATAVKNIKNLQFATTQTLPTKAVAAVEYFDATIIDSNDSGRILVLGEIKKGETDESKAVFNNPKNYSMALVVSDENKVGADDLGSYVSSDYVQVDGAGDAFEVGENIGWMQDGEFTQNWETTVKVQWDTKVKDSEKAFFEGVSAKEEDMVVNFKDAAILSFQDIKDIFGIEKPSVAFDEFDIKDSKSTIDTTGCDHHEYDKTTGKIVKTELSIVTTNRKNFEATAKLADTLTVKDLKRVNTVGDTRVAKIAGFKVNNVPQNGMSVKSTYEITYAGGDITISSPGMLPWNWREGDTWTSIYELAEGDDKTQSNAFLNRMKQLEITSNSDVDLTKLYSMETTGGQVSPAGFVQLFGEAYNEDGVKVKENVNIWVRILGSDRARLAGSTPGDPAGTTGLTFADEDLYWEFTGKAYDQKGKMYTIGFNTTKEKFVTSAAPKFDPNSYTFESEIKIEGYRTIDMKAEGLAPVTEILAKHPAYNVAEDEMADFMKGITFTVAGVTSNAYVETVDGVDKYENAAAANFTLATSWDAEEEEEVATITVKKEENVYYNETLTVTTKANVHGVEYTYIVKVKVQKPTWMANYIQANPTVATNANGNIGVEFAGGASAAYSIPSDLNALKFYNQSYDKLVNLKAGKVWTDKDGKDVNTEIKDEYEVYIVNADTFEANTDKIAEATKKYATDKTVVIPTSIMLPIAVVDQTTGDITWVEDLNGASDDDWTNAIRDDLKLVGGGFGLTTDGKDVTVNEGEKMKYNQNVYTFNVMLRTVADMSLPTKSAAKTKIPAEKVAVSTKAVKIELPNYVDFKTDTYVGEYADGETETVKASQKVLVKDKGSDKLQSVYVGSTVVIENSYNAAHTLANSWITDVEMVKYYYVDENGEYIWEGSGKVDPYEASDYRKPKDTDTITGETLLYSFKYVPVFEVWNNEAGLQGLPSWGNDRGLTFSDVLTYGSLTNVNALTFEELEWNNPDHAITTGNMGEVKLVKNGGDYEHPKYDATLAATTPSTDAEKTAWNDNNDLKYKAPAEGNYIATYDVVTGKLTLNNKVLQANTQMADLVITVPVVLDWNFNGEPQIEKVEVIFTDKADKDNTAIPYLPFWNEK